MRRNGAPEEIPQPVRRNNAPDDMPQPQTLYEQLSYIGHVLHRMNRHAGHESLDLSRGQGRVLALLQEHPHISQKELSGYMDMQPQSLGELLFKLERNGCIVRTRSQADGRAFDVHLTEAGRKFYQAGREQVQQTIPDLCSGFSPQEAEQLSGYLERVIQTLQNQYQEMCRGAGDDGRREHRHGRRGKPEDFVN